MTRIRIRAALVVAGALGLLVLAGAAGATTRGGLAPAVRNGGTLVAARGAYTVVIHLKSPYSPLTAQFADRSGMIMSPAQLDKLGDKFATNPICVGPFTYQNRVAGDSITVVKSPYYYAKKKVHLSKIIFKVENDTAAAAS